MPVREFSSDFNSATFDVETDEVILTLVEITHADLSSPIRVCNNNIAVAHDGNTYQAYPFELALPSSHEGQLPLARLKIDNVDRVLTAAARSITSPAECTIRVIRAVAPNTAELEVSLLVSRVRITADTLEADLEPRGIFMKPYPEKRWTPSTAPALFQQIT